MIANLILGVVSSVLTTILAGLVALVPALPSGITTGLGYVGSVIDLVRGFDTWVPVTLAFAVAGAVFACYATAWLLGALRMLVSYFTFGGGAT